MFSIYRTQSAMTPLQKTWEQGDDSIRAHILSASQRIDQELHHQPHRKGEARTGKTRILFQAPLAVLFEVDDARKLVHILRSWAFTVHARQQDYQD